MNKIKNIFSDKANHSPLFYTSLLVLAFLSLISRSFFSIVTTDEVFNIGQVYRTVIGQKFMVENWDFFQVGDSLSYPFIWLFYKITKSTEGVVLYSRLCFIFITFIFGIIIYKFLNPIFGKLNSFATCLIYFTSVPKTLFNYWYDTWALLFMLLSFVAIIYTVNCNKSISWILLAGMFQAIAVYAYPTAVFVFLFELIIIFLHINKEKKKISIGRPEFIYALGAAIVFVIFVIFCLTKDWQNFFIFNKGVSESGLSDRISLFKNGSILVKKVITSLLVTFKIYYILLCVLILLCFLIKKFRLSKIWLIAYILITAFFLCFYSVYLKIPGYHQQIQLYYFFYFSLCGLVIHLFFFLKEEKFQHLFLLLYFPSIISGFVWAFTGMDGGVNFTLGFRPAAIFFFLEFFEIVSCIDTKNIKGQFKILVSVLLLFNIVVLFSQSHMSLVPSQMFAKKMSLSTAENGVFKYVVDVKETIAFYETFEKTMNEIIENDDQTLLCGRSLMYGYLMTNLKPNTNYLLRPGSLTGFSTDSNFYDYLFRYFDSYYGYPDIIIIDKNQCEMQNEKFTDFIASNYELKTEYCDILFYHK